MTGFFIAARAAAGFYRLGRHFAQARTFHAISEFTEEEWRRLMAEPNLQVTPPTEEELAEMAAPELDDEELEAVKAAIRALPAEAFTQQGLPKMDALRAALKESGIEITDVVRDTAHRAVKEEQTGSSAATTPQD